MMKKDSFLINLSRGGIVDEKALFNALTNNKITGAAIDVFELIKDQLRSSLFD